MSALHENRIIDFSGNFPSGALLLASIKVEEALSQPFRIEAHVLVPKPFFDVESLIAKPLSFRLGCHGQTRHFHGVVRSAEYQSSTTLHQHWVLHIAPRLWFFSLNSDSRIWQKKSIIDIVEETLKRNQIPYLLALMPREYRRRSYVVQYQESDFAFVSRLLEAEGIYYYFDHSPTGHTMVLCDASPLARPLAEPSVLPFHINPEQAMLEPGVSRIARSSQIRPLGYSVADYNFIDVAELRRDEAETDEKKALPIVAQRFEYPAKVSSTAEAERYARIRLEEQQCTRRIIDGRSDHPLVRPGYRFELNHHPDPNFNQTYFVTLVRHEATNPDFLSKNTDSAAPVYRNTWSAIPSDTYFRPPRITPRARIHGTQTARVVGPEEGKPHTDKHGRVRVHFFWDRHDPDPTASSCWIRVSQPWAGQSWGAISIPRVGQEVIVDFLDGDPDRPIIVGRVYNGQMRPPWRLGDGNGGERVMGFRSRSIGGSGYNEISINDHNANEGIILHAQRNMSTTVLNDETIDVRNNRLERVGNNEPVEIAVDRQARVGSNEHLQVGANQSLKVGADRSAEVGANDRLTVDANRNTSVGKNEVNKIGLTRTTSIGISEMTNVGLAQSTNVGVAQVTIVGGVQINTVGFHQYNLCKGDTIIEAGTKLVLKGPGGSITIDASGISIQGTLVRINS